MAEADAQRYLIVLRDADVLMAAKLHLIITCLWHEWQDLSALETFMCNTKRRKKRETREKLVHM